MKVLLALIISNIVNFFRSCLPQQSVKEYKPIKVKTKIKKYKKRVPIKRRKK